MKRQTGSIGSVKNETFPEPSIWDELPDVTSASSSIVRLGHHVILALVAARELGERPVIDTAEALALLTGELIARSDIGPRFSIDE